MNNFIIGLGIAAIGPILNLLLKKYVTDETVARWGLAVKNVFKNIGTYVTLGLSQWKWSKGIWNSTIEPLVIIIFRVIVNNMIAGLVQGLESDKPSFKKKD